MKQDTKACLAHRQLPSGGVFRTGRRTVFPGRLNISDLREELQRRTPRNSDNGSTFVVSISLACSIFMLEEPEFAIESYTADTSATPTRDRCHPQMADRRDGPAAAVVLDGKGQKEAWDEMSVRVLKDCVRGPLRVHTMWGKDVEVLGGPQDFFKTLCEGIKVSVAEEGAFSHCGRAPLSS
jgi:hypothetical protein